MDTTPRLLRTFAVSRRHLLKATMITGGVTALSAFEPHTRAGIALAHSAAQEGGDAGLANFVLTLEHLQNALYRSLVGGSVLSGGTLAYAQEFGGHQQQHVQDLTTVIEDVFGGPAAQPLPAYNFPTFATQAEAVATVADIESLGAAAYLGAAPLIQDPTFLQQALAIHPVEGEHAAAFRLLAGREPVPGAFAAEQNQPDVVAAIQQYLAAVAALPDTGVTDTGWKMIGVAGGVAAAAAGMALARGTQPRAAEHE